MVHGWSLALALGPTFARALPERFPLLASWRPEAGTLTFALALPVALLAKRELGTMVREVVVAVTPVAPEAVRILLATSVPFLRMERARATLAAALRVGGVCKALDLAVVLTDCPDRLARFSSRQVGCVGFVGVVRLVLRLLRCVLRLEPGVSSILRSPQNEGCSIAFLRPVDEVHRVVRHPVVEEQSLVVVVLESTTVER